MKSTKTIKAMLVKLHDRIEERKTRSRSGVIWLEPDEYERFIKETPVEPPSAGRCGCLVVCRPCETVEEWAALVARQGTMIAELPRAGEGDWPGGH